MIFFCCTVSFKNFITSFLLAFLEFPPVRKCFRGLTFGTKQIKITVPENSFVLHFQLMPLTALDWKHFTDSIFSNPFFLNKRNSCPHVTVASEPERNGVFLTRSCVHVTDISCGVVYKATLASLVLLRSYCYVHPSIRQGSSTCCVFQNSGMSNMLQVQVQAETRCLASKYKNK